MSPRRPDDRRSTIAGDGTRGPPLRRWRTPLLMTAILLLSLATVTAATPPTLSSDDVALASGETGQTSIALSSAPDGVSGFNLTVGVGDASTATVVGASVGDGFELSEVTVAEDGSRATLVGVDLGETVTPGDEAVALATIELEGLEAGDTRLEFEAVSVEADDGEAIEPSLEAGAVAVSGTDDPRPTGSSGASTGDPAAPDESDGGVDSSAGSTKAGDGGAAGDDPAGTGANDATSEADSTSTDGSSDDRFDDGDAADATAESDEPADGGDDSLAMPWFAATALAVLAVAARAARSGRRGRR